MESQYTLPGVMQFLRSEWQQREQTKIEWELERAELLSRLSRLESENMDLRRDLNESQRHLEILMSTHKRKDSKGSAEHEGSANDNANGSKSNGKSNGSRANDEKTNGDKTDGDNTNVEETAESGTGNIPTDAANIEHIQAVSDDLISTVKDSKSYLKQCIADIRYILRQSGSVTGDSDPMVTLRTGPESQNFVTLANFGSSALDVASLPNNRVAAGTVNGDLLIWDKVDIEHNAISTPITFDVLDGAVNCVKYSPNSDRLIVACGNEIRVYDVNETPQLITSQSITPAVTAVADNASPEADDGSAIVHLVIAPVGNLLATVSTDGRTIVWSLQDGKELKLMSAPAHGVLTCAFALIHNDIHLVLARGPDSNIPDSAEGSLILVDPISGEALKKIIFLFTAGISAMSVTEDSIILGTDNGDIRVIGLARGETIAEITSAHRSEITSFSTQKDGSGFQTLISTSVDGRVSIWSLPMLMWKGRLFSHDSAYGALSSSSAAGQIVVSGGDGLIRVYSENE